MDSEMKVLHQSTRVMPDGTEVTLTISTAKGAPISEEDKAFIRRFIPMSAGVVLDHVEDENIER